MTALPCRPSKARAADEADKADLAVAPATVLLPEVVLALAGRLPMADLEVPADPAALLLEDRAGQPDLALRQSH